MQITDLSDKFGEYFSSTVFHSYSELRKTIDEFEKATGTRFDICSSEKRLPPDACVYEKISYMCQEGRPSGPKEDTAPHDKSPRCTSCFSVMHVDDGLMVTFSSMRHNHPLGALNLNLQLFEDKADHDTNPSQFIRRLKTCIRSGLGSSAPRVHHAQNISAQGSSGTVAKESGHTRAARDPLASLLDKFTKYEKGMILKDPERVISSLSALIQRYFDQKNSATQSKSQVNSSVEETIKDVICNICSVLAYRDMLVCTLCSWRAHSKCASRAGIGDTCPRCFIESKLEYIDQRKTRSEEAKQIEEFLKRKTESAQSWDKRKLDPSIGFKRRRHQTSPPLVTSSSSVEKPVDVDATSQDSSDFELSSSVPVNPTPLVNNTPPAQSDQVSSSTNVQVADLPSPPSIPHPHIAPTGLWFPFGNPTVRIDEEDLPKYAKLGMIRIDENGQLFYSAKNQLQPHHLNVPYVIDHAEHTEVPVTCLSGGICGAKVDKTTTSSEPTESHPTEDIVSQSLEGEEVEEGTSEDSEAEPEKDDMSASSEESDRSYSPSVEKPDEGPKSVRHEMRLSASGMVLRRNLRPPPRILEDTDSKQSSNTADIPRRGWGHRGRPRGRSSGGSRGRPLSFSQIDSPERLKNRQRGRPRGRPPGRPRGHLTHAKSDQPLTSGRMLSSGMVLRNSVRPPKWILEDNADIKETEDLIPLRSNASTSVATSRHSKMTDSVVHQTVSKPMQNGAFVQQLKGSGTSSQPIYLIEYMDGRPSEVLTPMEFASRYLPGTTNDDAKSEI